MNPAKSAKGVALLLVLASIAILTILSVELIYLAGIDSRLSSNQTNGLKAFYLSKSAARLALWRLNFFLYAQQTNNKTLPEKFINLIWNAPLPALPFDAAKLGVSTGERISLEKFKKESSATGTFLHTIEAEGSKISLNMLTGDKAWYSNEKIQLVIKRIIINMLEADFEKDRDYQDRILEKYTDFTSERAVSAIIDYIDKNKETVDAREPEESFYSALDPPRKPKDLPLYTLEELRMVQYWEGELYSKYNDQFSVLPGFFYLNVSTMDKKMFWSIAPRAEEKSLDDFLDNRSKIPFSDVEDFKKRFLDVPGVTADDLKDLQFTLSDRTFFITSLGESADVISKQLVGVRLDSLPVKNVDCTGLTEEKCEEKKTELPPVNHLRVVYWKEVIL